MPELIQREVIESNDINRSCTHDYLLLLLKKKIVITERSLFKNGCICHLLFLTLVTKIYI